MLFDAAIIGAGAIGTAVASALIKLKPSWRILVLEKEPSAALHASGRNSGVVHAGFNQEPGTLKAKFCVLGSRMLAEAAGRLGFPFKRVGTLVAAATPDETAVLEELLRRGNANGVEGLRIIESRTLKELEPNANGLAALYAPSGAIIDGRAFVEKLSVQTKEKGVTFLFSTRLTRIEETAKGYSLLTRFLANSSTASVNSRRLINCAGAYADQISRNLGVGLDFFIIPFRGEYYKLCAERSGLIHSMVYPVPNLQFPFLGIHWTKRPDGSVIVGPNAVPALGREAYRWKDVRLAQAAAGIFSAPFLKMLSRRAFWALAQNQIRLSLSKKAFLSRASKLVCGMKVEDLVPGPAGIRAQLVRRNGELMDDLVVLTKGTSLHVLNAVSPGLTCSLPFGEHIAKMAVDLWP